MLYLHIYGRTSAPRHFSKVNNATDDAFYMHNAQPSIRKISEVIPHRQTQKVIEAFYGHYCTNNKNDADDLPTPRFSTLDSGSPCYHFSRTRRSRRAPRSWLILEHAA